MTYQAGPPQNQPPILTLAELAQSEQARVRIIEAQTGSLTLVEHHGTLGRGRPIRLASDEAFLVRLHLKPCAAHGVWLEDDRLRCRPLAEGALVVQDLRRGWSFDIRAATHVLFLQIPLTMTAPQDPARESLLDALAKPGASFVDPVARDLAMLLPAALDASSARLGGFVESIVMALVAHLGYRTVDRDADPGLARGGLAPWQERRAKEIMTANLAGDVWIDQVAEACGLSRSQFARAFRLTTGLPPYRWLLHRRVEAARALLPQGDRSLAEVGHECGFADQSHFTRVFASVEGMPPGLWRRQHLTERYVGRPEDYDAATPE
jgi:AraC family transcriptional regulator